MILEPWDRDFMVSKDILLGRWVMNVWAHNLGFEPNGMDRDMSRDYEETIKAWFGHG
jgi:hypothetical protein